MLCFYGFTQEEHTIEVHDELVTSIEQLPTAAKQKLLGTIASALKTMAATLPSSPQRVKTIPTSEGAEQVERVQYTPPITTTNNLTEPCILKTVLQTHGRKTRNNTPGAVPLFNEPIKQTTAPLRRSPRLAKTEIPKPFKISREPNSTRIPMANSRLLRRGSQLSYLLVPWPFEDEASSPTTRPIVGRAGPPLLHQGPLRRTQML